MPRPAIGEAICQSFPPKPKFTEDDIPDLTGKVGSSVCLSHLFCD